MSDLRKVTILNYCFHTIVPKCFENAPAPRLAQNLPNTMSILWVIQQFLMAGAIKTSERIQTALDGTQIHDLSALVHKSLVIYSIWDTGIMSDAAFYYEWKHPSSRALFYAQARVDFFCIMSDAAFYYEWLARSSTIAHDNTWYQVRGTWHLAHGTRCQVYAPS